MEVLAGKNPALSSSTALCPPPHTQGDEEGVYEDFLHVKKKKNFLHYERSAFRRHLPDFFFLRGCPFLLRASYARKGAGREGERERKTPNGQTSIAPSGATSVKNCCKHTM